MKDISTHYQQVWGPADNLLLPSPSERRRFPLGYAVARFPPVDGRVSWIYATVGMSAGLADSQLELHVRVSTEDPRHAEVLHCVADFHRAAFRLSLYHTVNLGEPWLRGSLCTHAFVSLPYIDGPRIEWFHGKTGEILARCLWLVPITAEELALKKKAGVAALEDLFEANAVPYADLYRSSMTPKVR
jgi:hypothetical protein